jgi:hypothetical protein
MSDRVWEEMGALGLMTSQEQHTQMKTLRNCSTAVVQEWIVPHFSALPLFQDLEGASSMLPNVCSSWWEGVEVPPAWSLGLDSTSQDWQPEQGKLNTNHRNPHQRCVGEPTWVPAIRKALREKPYIPPAPKHSNFAMHC